MVKKGLSLISLAVALVLFSIAILLSGILNFFFLKFHIVGLTRNEMQFTDAHDSLLAFLSDMNFYRNFSFWLSGIRPIKKLSCNMPFICKIEQLGEMKIDENLVKEKLNLIAGDCFELNVSTKRFVGKEDCKLEILAKGYILTLERTENITLKK
ncbi:MAG: hypothetical protein QXQ18_00175 [Candidatus Aenigmatarchaeota archaeon]